MAGKKTKPKVTTKAVAKKETKKETKKTPWTSKQVALITKTVAKGATMDELHLFLYTANKVKLDPLAKQIYFNKFNTKDGPQMAIITGIDGYRAIAERSGSYAGSEDIIYDNGQAYEPGKEPNNPSTATAIVHRIVKGLKVSYTATARWKEYLPPTNKQFMWKKMPYLMLGKVAESLALRKAFPNDLSGLHTTEEMMQAGDPIDVVPEETKKIEKKPVQKEVKKEEPKEQEVFYCQGCDAEINKTDYELSQKLSKDGRAFCQECLKDNRKE